MAVHPFTSVPVTVYVVVDDGLAVTLAPVELLSEAEGVHTYEEAPLAVSVAGEPLQIAVFGETVRVMVLTVTVPWAVAVHPFASVPVTVYVMVEVGLAVTEEPVVALNPVAGVHVYELAPLAVSVVDCPLQIVAEVTDTTGSGFIVTVTCADAVHPFEVPVTVYVVVDAGFAVTDEPVVALNPVAGLHV